MILFANVRDPKLVSGQNLAAPVPPLLSHQQPLTSFELNPMRVRLRADVDLDEMRPNIAMSCLRLPDQPLSAWFGATGPLASAGGAE